MKSPNINKLSVVLFASATLMALLSSPPLVGPMGASLLAYVSTLLIFSRAVAEWFRPPGEALKAILWGIAVLVVYAIIMPFWAKVNALHGTAFPLAPALATGAIFLNLIVPLVRSVLNRTRRPV